MKELTLREAAEAVYRAENYLNDITEEETRGFPEAHDNLIKAWEALRTALASSPVDFEKALEEARQENDKLRALLAYSDSPCVYCGLAEMSRCLYGFPGCGRADDMAIMDNPWPKSKAAGGGE